MSERVKAWGVIIAAAVCGLLLVGLIGIVERGQGVKQGSAPEKLPEQHGGIPASSGSSDAPSGSLTSGIRSFKKYLTEGNCSVACGQAETESMSFHGIRCDYEKMLRLCKGAWGEAKGEAPAVTPPLSSETAIPCPSENVVSYNTFRGDVTNNILRRIPRMECFDVALNPIVCAEKQPKSPGEEIMKNEYINQ